MDGGAGQYDALYACLSRAYATAKELTSRGFDDGRIHVIRAVFGFTEPKLAWLSKRLKEDKEEQKEANDA